MTEPCYRRVALLVLLAVAAPVAAADEHDAARELRQEGEILPLETILDRLELAPESRLLETELEREGKRWLYELEVLGPEGRVREHEVDAASGDILRTEKEAD